MMLLKVFRTWGVDERSKWNAISEPVFLNVDEIVSLTQMERNVTIVDTRRHSTFYCRGVANATAYKLTCSAYASVIEPDDDCDWSAESASAAAPQPEVPDAIETLKAHIEQSNREWWRLCALTVGKTESEAEAFADAQIRAGLTAADGIRMFGATAARESEDAECR